jgi:hypothetical protein
VNPNITWTQSLTGHVARLIAAALGNFCFQCVCNLGTFSRAMTAAAYAAPGRLIAVCSRRSRLRGCFSARVDETLAE